MNDFVNIVTIELPYSKKEIKLQKEIKSEEKQKERKRISTDNMRNFLSKNIADFNLGDIVYNLDTSDKFVVTNLNPLDIKIL